MSETRDVIRSGPGRWLRTIGMGHVCDPEGVYNRAQIIPPTFQSLDITNNCDWKVAYARWCDAEDAAERTPDDHPSTGPIIPYWCEAHAGWHNGHFSRRRAYENWGHELYSKVFALTGKAKRPRWRKRDKVRQTATGGDA